jgi:hypothetical protein
MIKSMKKILTYLLIISVFITSCELDETPYSALFTDNYYSNAAEAETAINAAYSTLIDLYNGGGGWMAPELCSDQMYPRNVVARGTYTLFTYEPEYAAQTSFNRQFESPIQLWQTAYRGIERANIIIEKIPAVRMDSIRRNEMLGEGYFLRAYFHWTLTKSFGDVIVKTKVSQTEADAYNASSPKAEVYKQIYADLNAAVPLLKSYVATSHTRGRPSKEVAIALLAKVALYNEDYATALSKANEVITSGKYQLIPEYKDIFDVTKKNGAARQEILWAVESEANSNPPRGPVFAYLMGPPGIPKLEYGAAVTGSVFVYYSFWQSFNRTDKRRALLDTTYRAANGTFVRQSAITPITPFGVYLKKYIDPNSNNGNYGNLLPILRMADIRLIAAEAEARLNGATATAYQNINLVRTRAGLPNLTTGLSKDAFISAVLQERSWELFGEMDRWYDLSRTNTFIDAVKKATNNVFPDRSGVQPKHRYFPIPRLELNANSKLQQNPDWR